ncbi:MAG: hypothetical protein JNM85_06455 [Chthonomonas sp.]|nr:hypothetical protein [Chthonomonas sp.]
MDSATVREAFKRQNHAALATLRQIIDECPPEVWTQGEHPRTFWRQLFHAAGYAHLYLYSNLQAWQRWPKHRVDCTYLDGEAEVVEPYTQAEMREFVDLIDSEVDAQIDSLDLDEPHCGYNWYPGVSRFELLILSLRHLHGHIGQLDELLRPHGIDIEWRGEYSPRELDACR